VGDEGRSSWGDPLDDDGPPVELAAAEAAPPVGVVVEDLEVDTGHSFRLWFAIVISPRV
jgi:hypothetical protein